MGNQCVGRRDNLYQKVWESYIGALVPSMTMPSLIKCFKVEKHGELGLNKRITCRNKALIVVLSGRVELVVSKVDKSDEDAKFVQVKSDKFIKRRLSTSILSSPKKDALCTYIPGDIISFFGCTEFESNFNADGSFCFDDDINITLIATGSNTKVAYMEVSDFNYFLESNPKLTALQTISNVSLSSMLSGLNLYKGVSTKQLDFLGMFMKISVIGDNCLVSSDPTKDLKIKHLRKHSFNPLCGLLLQGTLHKVPDNDLENLEVSGHLPTRKNRPSDLFSSISRTGHSVPISSSRYASIHAFNIPVAPTISASYEKLGIGYTFGIRSLFYRRKEKKNELNSFKLEPDPDNLYSFGTCVIGEFSSSALNSLLGHTKSLFSKRMTNNFTRQAVEAIENFVPFISEMPIDKKEKLIKELRLVFFDDGDKLFSEGDPGDALYIIVDGGVQETRNNTTEFFSSSEYVGEMAITSEDVHRSTAIAMEKTYAIEMTAKSFNDIFSNNNESSEVKIRMAGTKVELQVILDYPQTYSLFEKFLKKEHNDENINFYHAVKRFALMAHLVNDKIMKLSTKASSQKSPQSPNSSTSITASDIDMTAEGLQHPSVSATSDLLLSLAHSIRELHDFAEADCSKYIAEGSSEQVNVSGATRLAVMTEIKGLAERRKVFDQQTSSGGLSTEEVLGTAAPLVEKLSRVFDRPKKEIYDVMAKDPFQRWKQTQEFAKAIETLKAVKDPSARGSALGCRGSSYNFMKDGSNSGHERNGSIGAATGYLLRKLSGFTGLKGPPTVDKGSRFKPASQKLVRITEDS